MIKPLLLCKVCGTQYRSFVALCANDCCLVCHALYCHPAGHTLDLQKAQADYLQEGTADLPPIPTPTLRRNSAKRGWWHGAPLYDKAQAERAWSKLVSLYKTLG